MLTLNIANDTLLLLWMSSATGVQGVLWSLLLTNPNLGQEAIQPKVMPNYSSNDQEAVDVRISLLRHHHGKEVCSADSACKKGMFCDRYYGICDHLRKEGGHCRRDYQCERSQECVSGRCRKHVKSGEKGARCQADNDCGASMCCARHHGEHVCKSRLPIGHKCFIPKGGLMKYAQTTLDWSEK